MTAIFRALKIAQSLIDRNFWFFVIRYVSLFDLNGNEVILLMIYNGRKDYFGT